VQVSVPAGAGAIEWFEVPALAALDGAAHALEAIVVAAHGPVPQTLPQTPRNRDDPPPPVAAVQDRVVSTNFVALATPGNMRLLAANVTVTATRTGPCR